jgi:hypothetical protein
MVDVFLMGTAGKITDPNRSMWREPFKTACTEHGITFFDPVVSEWNEEAQRREVDALATAKVIVMVITSDTPAIASLAESGWAAMSALQRKQAFGLYIDPQYKGQKITEPTMMVRVESMIPGSGQDSVDDASRRARKLVNSHATRLSTQFPTLNLYVARSLDELKDWTMDTARKLILAQKKTWWSRR